MYVLLHMLHMWSHTISHCHSVANHLHCDISKNCSHLIKSNSLTISRNKENCVAITDPFQSWSGMKKAHGGRRHHLKSKVCLTFPRERASGKLNAACNSHKMDVPPLQCNLRQWNLQENCSRTSTHKWNVKCLSIAISTGSAAGEKQNIHRIYQNVLLVEQFLLIFT